VQKTAVLLPGMLGAGCTSVAFELAKLTGMKVVNSELIIREIVSEKRVTFAELTQMARDGEIDLEDLVRNVALDYISEGDVIVEGRTALMLLDRPVLLKVFLYADKKVRVERVAKRRGISIEEAAREVERSDEDRGRLTERLYKKHFTDPSLYDMMLDTTYLSYSEAAVLLKKIIKWRLETISR